MVQAASLVNFLLDLDADGVIRLSQDTDVLPFGISQFEVQDLDEFNRFEHDWVRNLH